MKAAICTKYGPPNVIKIEEIKKPIPKKNEILIRINCATVQTGDCKVRDLVGVATSAVKYNPIIKFIMRLMMGYNRPRNPVFGTELCGKIESIGKNVTKHKIGDEVVVMTDIKMGAHKEYLTWPEGKLIIDKPSRIASEQAAAISFGGIAALHFLRKSKIKDGQKILINGASGAVGTAAVQLAKYFGAIVTGVCGPDNVDLVKSIGADLVIDYSKENIEDINSKFDIIFDAIGKTSKNECKKILRSNGMYVTVLNGMVMGKQEDLAFLKNRIDENKYTPIIDKCFTLDEIVEAHKYVETGHKKGNVVIKI